MKARGLGLGATHQLQLLLGLCLHLPDVVHGQLHPLINGAEELPVEVGEDPLLLLRRTGRSLEERIPGQER